MGKELVPRDIGSYRDSVRARAEMVRLRREDRRLRLLEAREARFGRSELAASSGRSWAGVAIALSVVAVAGVIIVVLLRRRRDGSQEVTYVPMPVATQPVGVSGTSVEIIEEDVAMTQPRRSLARTLSMRTFALPILTAADAVRICQATDTPAEATIRVVGPAGTFAVLAVNSVALNSSNAKTGSAPTGDTAIIPAGDKQIIHLKPKQGIVAKGSATGVQISVTMTDYTPGWL